MEPPEAGGNAISVSFTIVDALTVGGAGLAAYSIKTILKVWLEKFADESYAPVRDALLRLFKKVPNKWRVYVPLEITVGAVRFSIEDPLTDAEFCKRLRSAIDIADALPEEGLEGTPGPDEFGLEWNEYSQSWSGKIYLEDGYLRYHDGKWTEKIPLP